METYDDWSGAQFPVEDSWCGNLKESSTAFFTLFEKCQAKILAAGTH